MFTDEERHRLYEGYCRAANPREYIDKQAARHHCDRQLIREAVGLRTPDPTKVPLPDVNWNNNDLFPESENKAPAVQPAKARRPVPKKRKPRIDADVKAAAMEGLRAGMTLREAEKEFRVSKTTLQCWLVKAGIAKPYGPRKKK